MNQIKREAKLWGLLAFFSISMLITSLCLGKYPLSVSEIVTIILGKSSDEMARQVFLSLRLPRTIMVFLAGFGLSMAGGVYQNMFKNPLAAPDLIGVVNGATAGAAFSVICLGMGMAMTAVSAFVGGIVSVLLVVVISTMTRQKTGATYILAGIVVKTAAEAFVMSMKYFADPERQLAVIDYWAMGSFANVTMDKIRVVICFIIIGFVGLYILRWHISLLSLEDDELQMMGMKVTVIRYMVLGFSTLMVASIVCVTGVISFIGLIAPHIARLITKRSDFYMCMTGGIIGSILLLIADCFARSIAGSEVPISILTSAAGVPVLIYLLCKKGE